MGSDVKVMTKRYLSVRLRVSLENKRKERKYKITGRSDGQVKRVESGTVFAEISDEKRTGSDSNTTS